MGSVIVLICLIIICFYCHFYFISPPSLLFCSFHWEDEQPVISTGMVFHSMTMKILSQGRWTSSQVFHCLLPPSSPTTVCWCIAWYTQVEWLLLLAVLNVYSIFYNNNRRDLFKASLILIAPVLTFSRHDNNHYFRDSRDYCICKKCTSKSTSLECPDLLSSLETVFCALQEWLKCLGRSTWVGQYGLCRSCSRKSTTSIPVLGSYLRSTSSSPHRYSVHTRHPFSPELLQ